MTLTPGTLWLAVIIFVTAMIVSFACTGASIMVAHRFDLLDHPGKIKLHGRPVPFLGGTAIFIAFWSVFAACVYILALPVQWGGLLQNVSADAIAGFTHFGPRMAAMFWGGLMILILGLVDDKYALKPYVKLAGQIVVAILIVRSGFGFDFLHQMGPAGSVVTVFWIVLLLNAFNFIDSINGHCAGIVFIACGAFMAISQAMHQPVLGLMMIVLGGAILGFLPYNFHNAKTFLGDNGSMFLGYMMAIASLQASYRILQPTELTPMVPFFIFGVPIYDLTSVVCVRLYRGQPPWRGDRNHFAHRLIRMGLDGNDAVLFSYLVAVTTGLMAVLSTQVTSIKGNMIIMLLYFMILMIIAILEYHSACYIEKKMGKSHHLRGDRR